MSATSPAKVLEARSASKDERRTDAPDIAHFRARYPLTVASFGSLHEREAWLRRIWETETRFLETSKKRGGGRESSTEAIVRGAPPARLSIEGEFEVVYACGAHGLLHASALAVAHKRRVLAFGETLYDAREWTLSQEDLERLEGAGLFTKEEIESAVVNRFRAGFVKFHDAASRIKAEPLWVSGVLDAALDAQRLARLAAEKLLRRGREGCAIIEGARFVRAYVEPDRVCVEVEDGRGARRLFAARLFVDATGASSPVAQQLNDGRALTHVCPTVGTIARGYVRGEGAGAVDFGVGEILVSTEDASDHRQLVWAGRAGSSARDEFTTRMFFYDDVSSPADKSLLSLFERYFERLPAYKRQGSQWKVERPVFGYAHARRRALRVDERRASFDRVALLCDATQESPLATGGHGERLRDVRKVAHLTHLALEADLLDESALAEVSESGGAARASRSASLAEFLRPSPRSAPSAVNETLNALMAALHHLDERERREMFLDRMSLSTLKKIFSRTVKLYPRIFARVREQMGTRGGLRWIAGLIEGAWRERRERASAHELDGRSAGVEGDARREFARCVARYKEESDAGR